MGRYKHIFGPVLSRRLGLSLGIDLVPYKTCSLNCIYCECGPTTHLTDERREYVNTEEVLKELEEFLSNSPAIDYITFSGSGEPTLHSGIGKIIDFIKRDFPGYSVALLTNGTLFQDESVIDEVKRADLIKPSLDAATDDIFQKINRPNTGLKIKNIINGLVNLRERYGGQIYLEIFIVPGINDSPEEIKRLAEAAGRIRPDRIQLNTLDRPPAVPGIKKAGYKDLLGIASLFEPIAEIISRYDPKQLDVLPSDIEDLILQMINRRPCTREEIRALFSLRMKEVDEILERLLQQNRIRIVRGPRGDYYGSV